MSHQVATIKMHAGDSLPITVTITDDGTATGEPVDLTDAETVTFTIARGYGGVPIIEKTAEALGGINITGGAQGIAVITLDPEDTEDLAGLYTHVTRAILEDGTVMTPLSGRLIIERTSAVEVP